MKIKELYSCSMNPKWAKVKKMLDFIDFSTQKCSSVNLKDEKLFDYMKRTTKCMRHYINMILNTDKSSDRYKILMTASIFYPICREMYNSKNYNEFISILRGKFYDEDVVLRETICALVGCSPINVNSEFEIKELISLSYNYYTVEDFLIFLGVCLKSKYYKLSKNELFTLNTKLRLSYIRSCRCLFCDNKPYTFDNKLQKLQHFYGDVKFDNMSRNNFKVYFMIGIPGSGKSTWIKNNLGDDAVVISRDTIRTEIGIGGDKPIGDDKQEKMVSRIFDERLIDACKNGKTVVIDNTNLKLKYRNHFHDIILTYNPEIVYVYNEAPSLEDNFKRRDGQIKKEVIQRMWNNFEFPLPYEYDKIIYNIQ